MLSENSEHGLQLGCSQRELQGLVWGGRLVSMKRGKAGKGQGPGRTPSPRSGFPQCEAKVRDWPMPSGAAVSSGVWFWQEVGGRRRKVPQVSCHMPWNAPFSCLEL